MGIKAAYKEQLLTIIYKRLPGCRVYLFGSRARGDDVHGSDIDIALDAGNAISRDILLNIGIDIDETTIPMKVDVIDLYTASDELKKDIMREGILWTN